MRPKVLAADHLTAFQEGGPLTPLWATATKGAANEVAVSSHKTRARLEQEERSDHE